MRDDLIEDAVCVVVSWVRYGCEHVPVNNKRELILVMLAITIVRISDINKKLASRPVDRP